MVDDSVEQNVSEQSPVDSSVPVQNVVGDFLSRLKS